MKPETSESRHWWEQEHTGGRIGLVRAQLAEMRLLENFNLVSLMN